MKTLLKVLRKDMTSPYQSFEYKLNKWYTCKNFDDDPKNDCTRGFYAVDVEGLPYAYRPDKQIWWCEVDGKEVEYDIYKRRYEKMRITHRANLDEIKQMAVSREQKCGYKLSEVLFPFNPLKVFTDEEAKAREIVTPLILDKLREWMYIYCLYHCCCTKDHIRDSVRDSVLSSIVGSDWEDAVNPIWNCIEGSVDMFVYQSVRRFISKIVYESVDNIIAAHASSYQSVDDIVTAYVSSLFPGIKNWKGIDHEPGTNPLQPGIDLWRSGFVPSYDGEKWRLHAGPKATPKITVVWVEE